MASPAPIRVGGHPALDFLNTIASPQGEPIEFLPDGTSLLSWLVLTGSIDATDARTLARRCSGADLDATARQAVALREWLRPIVERSATAGNAKVSTAELQRLNALLARGSRFPEAARSGPAIVVRPVRRWTSAGELLAPIAEAIADLLAGDFALVRRCGGAGCTLWFLDRTKGHRRQWCSMALCGNRAKVAAHRRRAKRATGRGSGPRPASR